MPLFFLVYFLVDRRLKNWVILAGSIVFYAWGAPQFIFVILATTVADFYIVRMMDASRTDWLRKLLLSLSLSINLGLLFYFKYSNFFVQNLNHVLQQIGMKQVGWTSLVLPIGISFYTFETLTYVVDVYRKVHKPLRNFWDYQLYIILFPKLIAGPIIRFHDFADQIYDHTEHENAENRLRGLYRFFIGLGKKILIANVMGAAADTVFNIPHQELGTATAWWGALSYTFQIYFDFSGYSDMAIGLGLMMGFRIPENFNNPYTATSITDFWRRWHITLGSWMRNYLYIPLGGNRGSKWRTYINLWIVFLASGLWHGAAWGYVAWGAYHGFFLVMERLFLGKWLAKLGKASFIYSFFVVLIGWVFFRIEHIRPSLAYLGRLFSWHKSSEAWLPTTEYYTIFAVACLFSFFTIANWGQRIQQRFFYAPYPVRRHYLVATLMLVICLLSASRIATSSFNPFIYFRF
ncbi:MBOAT family O-acyltransferase [Taibaiella soli]|nr:MBOAT family O-acyltransferase [Taibaiella soli]